MIAANTAKKLIGVNITLMTVITAVGKPLQMLNTWFIKHFNGC